MKVTYLDAADSEFDEAIAYYNDERAGLGFEFADEVKEALERIKNYPEAWTPSACVDAKSIVSLTALSTKFAAMS